LPARRTERETSCSDLGCGNNFCYSLPTLFADHREPRTQPLVAYDLVLMDMRQLADASE
jgi:hypothetical protein